MPVTLYQVPKARNMSFLGFRTLKVAAWKSCYMQLIVTLQLL